MLGPTLLDLKEQLGVSEGAASVLFPCRALGYMAGAQLGGKLGRARNIALALLVPLSLTCMGAAAVAFVRDLALACLLMSLQGVAMSDPEGEGAVSSVVLGSGVFLFVYVGIEVAFGGYVDAFAQERTWLGASKLDAAQLTSVYWGALCLGRLVAAAATSHVHHARYLAMHLVLGVVEGPKEDMRANQEMDDSVRYYRAKKTYYQDAGTVDMVGTVWYFPRALDHVLLRRDLLGAAPANGTVQRDETADVFAARHPARKIGPRRTALAVYNSVETSAAAGLPAAIISAIEKCDADARARLSAGRGAGASLIALEECGNNAVCKTVFAVSGMAVKRLCLKRLKKGEGGQKCLVADCIDESTTMGMQAQKWLRRKTDIGAATGTAGEPRVGSAGWQRGVAAPVFAFGFARAARPLGGGGDAVDCQRSPRSFCPCQLVLALAAAAAFLWNGAGPLTRKEH
ncbi:unnamed protein product [Prorocentrum cordatum]|uniref:Solute carrier family 40 protein n=1 Tax=Prorocentrum cordatum TaxID=2364126 RepID=A0ABN9YCY4_9DINO|nr:unnamed protein product [Polarella glacialis]